jgi:hypothetical protein
LPTKNPVFEVSIDSNILAMAENAQKMVSALKQIRDAAILMTNHNDWIDMDNKPYLTINGAKKIARVFGVKWNIDSIEKDYLDQSNPHGHYMYTYTMTFIMGKDSIQAIGTKKSNDGFFSKRYSKQSGKRETLPATEVDMANIKKSAFTNCVGNGIGSILGMKNLTWEELEQYNLNKKTMSAVKYSEKQSDSNTMTEQQRKICWGKLFGHFEKDKTKAANMFYQYFGKDAKQENIEFSKAQAFIDDFDNIIKQEDKA